MISFEVARLHSASDVSQFITDLSSLAAADDIRSHPYNEENEQIAYVASTESDSSARELRYSDCRVAHTTSGHHAQGGEESNSVVDLRNSERGAEHSEHNVEPVKRNVSGTRI